MQQLDLQFYTFFVMVLAGMAGGLLFDVSRAIRWEFRTGRIITGLMDLVFWVMATLVVAGALIVGNWGVLRLYVPVGLGLGLVFYHYLASPVMLAVFRFFLRMLRRVLAVIWRALRVVFLNPVVDLAADLKGPIGHLVAPAGRLVTQLRAKLAQWRGSAPPSEK